MCKSIGIFFCIFFSINLSAQNIQTSDAINEKEDSQTENNHSNQHSKDLEIPKKHHLSYVSGFGAIRNETLSLDPTISNYRLTYQYAYTQDWGVELGYLSGNSEGFNILFENLIYQEKIEFNAIQLGVYRKLIKNNKHSFYTRLHLNIYDYKTFSDRGNSANFSGTTFGLGFGWQYDFSEQLGLMAEFSYDDFSRLDARTFNLGLAFAF